MLIILELANNHQGDVELGKRIIREHAEVTKKYPQFQYAFKFQYRDLPTFIHPTADENHKYVKRFRQTNLSLRDRLVLKGFAEGLGFKTACTPFDEQSVIDVADHGYDILKVGSPSFNDWALWDCIFKTWDGPIIASVGGATQGEIDKVVSECIFWKQEQLDLTLMHCVSKYPCRADELELNQIRHLGDRHWRKEYPWVDIGYSTHESPDSFGVALAMMLGINTVEWHVCTDGERNAYSLTAAESSKRLMWMDGAWHALGTDRALRVPGPVPTQFQRQMIDGRMWWKP